MQESNKKEFFSDGCKIELHSKASEYVRKQVKEYNNTSDISKTLNFNGGHEIVEGTSKVIVEENW